jgi:CDP-diacylglycerol--glycerol-3-phosphate 3-phosphatidyltransferase
LRSDGGGRKLAAVVSHEGPLMANLVTLTRLLLLFALVALATLAPPAWRAANAPLILLIIAMDGLDGWIARRRGEASPFGSAFDIAVDRAVENVMWLLLAHLGLAPLWVAIVFIVRGALVDSIRSDAVKDGGTPFGMMRSEVGRFLVAGRFMRGFYGTLKAVAFAWLLAMESWGGSEAAWSGVAAFVSASLICGCVTLCLLRGVPVLIEFAVRHKAFDLAALRGTR